MFSLTPRYIPPTILPPDPSHSLHRSHVPLWSHGRSFRKPDSSTVWNRSCSLWVSFVHRISLPGSWASLADKAESLEYYDSTSIPAMYPMVLFCCSRISLSYVPSDRVFLPFSETVCYGMSLLWSSPVRSEPHRYIGGTFHAGE